MKTNKHCAAHVLVKDKTDELVKYLQVQGARLLRHQRLGGTV